MRTILISFTAMLALSGTASAQVAMQPRWDTGKLTGTAADYAMAKRFQDAPWVDPNFHGYAQCREGHRFCDNGALNVTRSR